MKPYILSLRIFVYLPIIQHERTSLCNVDITDLPVKQTHASPWNDPRSVSHLLSEVPHTVLCHPGGYQLESSTRPGLQVPRSSVRSPAVLRAGGMPSSGLSPLQLRLSTGSHTSPVPAGSGSPRSLPSQEWAAPQGTLPAALKWLQETAWHCLQWDGSQLRYCSEWGWLCTEAAMLFGYLQLQQVSNT